MKLVARAQLALRAGYMTLQKQYTKMWRAAVLTLAVLPALTQGLFFDMTPEAERCFTEIVGEDTKMVVEYENPDFVPFGRPGFTGVVSPAAEVCCCFGPVRPPRPPHAWRDP